MTGEITLQEVIDCILKSGAVKIAREGERCFKLSSGGLSLYYIDLRKVLFGNPECLKKIVRALISKFELDKLNFDFIACKALGAVPLAVALSYELNKPIVVLRERMKDYGVKGKLVCPLDSISGKKCIVVDDVSTTGNTLLEVISEMRNLGAEVVKVIVVVDRLEGAREKLKEVGLNLECLLTRRDLGITDEIVKKSELVCREA